MIKNSLLNNTTKRGHIKRRLKTYFLVIFQILLIANPVIPVNPVGPPYQAPPVGWIIKDEIDFYGTGWDNSSGQSYIDPYHSGYKLTVSPSEITFKTFTDVSWDGYSTLNFSIGAISSTSFSIYINNELLLAQSIGSGNFTFDVQQKAKLLQLHKYEEVYIKLGSNSEIDYLGFESDRPKYFGVYNTQNYELTFSGIQSGTDIELQPSEGVGAYFQGYTGTSDDLYYPELGVWASMLPKSYRAKIAHFDPTEPTNIINMATAVTNQGFESNFVTLEKGGSYSLDIGAVGLSQEYGGYQLLNPLMVDLYWEEQGGAIFSLGIEQVNFGSYTELNVDLTSFSGSNGKILIYPELTGFLQEVTNSTNTRDVFVHFGDISISHKASTESIVKTEYLPATEMVESNGVSITSGEVIFDDISDFGVYHYLGANGDDINRLMLLVSSSSVNDYFEFDAVAIDEYQVETIFASGYYNSSGAYGEDVGAAKLYVSDYPSINTTVLIKIVITSIQNPSGYLGINGLAFSGAMDGLELRYASDLYWQNQFTSIQYDDIAESYILRAEGVPFRQSSETSAPVQIQDNPSFEDTSVWAGLTQDAGKQTDGLYSAALNGFSDLDPVIDDIISTDTLTSLDTLSFDIYTVATCTDKDSNPCPTWSGLSDGTNYYRAYVGGVQVWEQLASDATNGWISVNVDLNAAGNPDGVLSFELVVDGDKKTGGKPSSRYTYAIDLSFWIDNIQAIDIQVVPSDPYDTDQFLIAVYDFNYLPTGNQIFQVTARRTDCITTCANDDGLPRSVQLGYRLAGTSVPFSIFSNFNIISTDYHMVRDRTLLSISNSSSYEIALIAGSDGAINIANFGVVTSEIGSTANGDAYTDLYTNFEGTSVDFGNNLTRGFISTFQGDEDQFTQFTNWENQIVNGGGFGTVASLPGTIQIADTWTNGTVIDNLVYEIAFSYNSTGVELNVTDDFGFFEISHDRLLSDDTPDFNSGIKKIDGSYASSFSNTDVIDGIDSYIIHKFTIIQWFSTSSYHIKGYIDGQLVSIFDDPLWDTTVALGSTPTLNVQAGTDTRIHSISIHEMLQDSDVLEGVGTTNKHEWIVNAYGQSILNNEYIILRDGQFLRYNHNLGTQIQDRVSGKIYLDSFNDQSIIVNSTKNTNLIFSTISDIGVKYAIVTANYNAQSTQIFRLQVSSGEVSGKYNFEFSQDVSQLSIRFWKESTHIPVNIGDGLAEFSTTETIQFYPEFKTTNNSYLMIDKVNFGFMTKTEGDIISGSGLNFVSYTLSENSEFSGEMTSSSILEMDGSSLSTTEYFLGMQLYIESLGDIKVNPIYEAGIDPIYLKFEENTDTILELIISRKNTVDGITGTVWYSNGTSFISTNGTFKTGDWISFNIEFNITSNTFELTMDDISFGISTGYDIPMLNTFSGTPTLIMEGGPFPYYTDDIYVGSNSWGFESATLPGYLISSTNLIQSDAQYNAADFIIIEVNPVNSDSKIIIDYLGVTNSQITLMDKIGNGDYLKFRLDNLIANTWMDIGVSSTSLIDIKSLSLANDIPIRAWLILGEEVHTSGIPFEKVDSIKVIPRLIGYKFEYQAIHDAYDNDIVGWDQNQQDGMNWNAQEQLIGGGDGSEFTFAENDAEWTNENIIVNPSFENPVEPISQTPISYQCWGENSDPYNTLGFSCYTKAVSNPQTEMLYWNPAETATSTDGIYSYYLNSVQRSVQWGNGEWTNWRINSTISYENLSNLSFDMYTNSLIYIENDFDDPPGAPATSEYSGWNDGTSYYRVYVGETLVWELLPDQHTGGVWTHYDLDLTTFGNPSGDLRFEIMSSPNKLKGKWYTEDFTMGIDNIASIQSIPTGYYSGFRAGYDGSPLPTGWNAWESSIPQIMGEYLRPYDTERSDDFEDGVMTGWEAIPDLSSNGSSYWVEQNGRLEIAGSAPHASDYGAAIKYTFANSLKEGYSIRIPFEATIPSGSLISRNIFRIRLNPDPAYYPGYNVPPEYHNNYTVDMDFHFGESWGNPGTWDLQASFYDQQAYDIPNEIVTNFGLISDILKGEWILTENHEGYVDVILNIEAGNARLSINRTVSQFGELTGFELFAGTWNGSPVTYGVDWDQDHTLSVDEIIVETPIHQSHEMTFYHASNLVNTKHIITGYNENNDTLYEMGIEETPSTVPQIILKLYDSNSALYDSLSVPITDYVYNTESDSVLFYVEYLNYGGNAIRLTSIYKGGSYSINITNPEVIIRHGYSIWQNGDSTERSHSIIKRTLTTTFVNGSYEYDGVPYYRLDRYLTTDRSTYGDNFSNSIIGWDQNQSDGLNWTRETRYINEYFEANPTGTRQYPEAFEWDEYDGAVRMSQNYNSPRPFGGDMPAWQRFNADINTSDSYSISTSIKWDGHGRSWGFHLFAMDSQQNLAAAVGIRESLYYFEAPYDRLADLLILNKAKSKIGTADCADFYRSITTPTTFVHYNYKSTAACYVSQNITPYYVGTYDNHANITINVERATSDTWSVTIIFESFNSTGHHMIKTNTGITDIKISRIEISQDADILSRPANSTSNNEFIIDAINIDNVIDCDEVCYEQGEASMLQLTDTSSGLNLPSLETFDDNKQPFYMDKHVTVESMQVGQQTWWERHLLYITDGQINGERYSTANYYSWAPQSYYSFAPESQDFKLNLDLLVPTISDNGKIGRFMLQFVDTSGRLLTMVEYLDSTSTDVGSAGIYWNTALPNGTLVPTSRYSSAIDNTIINAEIRKSGPAYTISYSGSVSDSQSFNIQGDIGLILIAYQFYGNSTTRDIDDFYFDNLETIYDTYGGYSNNYPEQVWDPVLDSFAFRLKSNSQNFQLSDSVGWAKGIHSMPEVQDLYQPDIAIDQYYSQSGWSFGQDYLTANDFLSVNYRSTQTTGQSIWVLVDIIDGDLTTYEDERPRAFDRTVWIEIQLDSSPMTPSLDTSINLPVYYAFSQWYTDSDVLYEEQTGHYRMGHIPQGSGQWSGLTLDMPSLIGDYNSVANTNYNYRAIRGVFFGTNGDIMSVRTTWFNNLDIGQFPSEGLNGTQKGQTDLVWKQIDANTEGTLDLAGNLFDFQKGEYYDSVLSTYIYSPFEYTAYLTIESNHYVIPEGVSVPSVVSSQTGKVTYNMVLYPGRNSLKLRIIHNPDGGDGWWIKTNLMTDSDLLMTTSETYEDDTMSVSAPFSVVNTTLHEASIGDSGVQWRVNNIIKTKSILQGEGIHFFGNAMSVFPQDGEALQSVLPANETNIDSIVFEKFDQFNSSGWTISQEDYQDDVILVPYALEYNTTDIDGTSCEFDIEGYEICSEYLTNTDHADYTAGSQILILFQLYFARDLNKNLTLSIQLPVYFEEYFTYPTLNGRLGVSTVEALTYDDSTFRRFDEFGLNDTRDWFDDMWTSGWDTLNSTEGMDLIIPAYTDKTSAGFHRFGILLNYMGSGINTTELDIALSIDSRDDNINIINEPTAFSSSQEVLGKRTSVSFMNDGTQSMEEGGEKSVAGGSFNYRDAVPGREITGRYYYFDNYLRVHTVTQILMGISDWDANEQGLANTVMVMDMWTEHESSSLIQVGVSDIDNAPSGVPVYDDSDLSTLNALPLYQRAGLGFLKGSLSRTGSLALRVNGDLFGGMYPTIIRPGLDSYTSLDNLSLNQRVAGKGLAVKFNQIYTETGQDGWSVYVPITHLKSLDLLTNSYSYKVMNNLDISRKDSIIQVQFDNSQNTNTLNVYIIDQSMDKGDLIYTSDDFHNIFISLKDSRFTLSIDQYSGNAKYVTHLGSRAIISSVNLIGGSVTIEDSSVIEKLIDTERGQFFVAPLIGDASLQRLNTLNSYRLNGFGAWFKKSASIVSGAFNTVVDAIVDASGNILDKTGVNAAIDVGQELLNTYIVAPIARLSDQILSGTMHLASIFMSSISHVVLGIGSQLNTLWNSVGAQLHQWSNAINDFIVAGASLILNAAANVLAAAVAIVKTAIKLIKAAIAFLLDGIKAIGRFIKDKVEGFFSDDTDDSYDEPPGGAAMALGLNAGTGATPAERFKSVNPGRIDYPGLWSAGDHLFANLKHLVMLLAYSAIMGTGIGIIDNKANPICFDDDGEVGCLEHNGYVIKLDSLVDGTHEATPTTSVNGEVQAARAVYVNLNRSNSKTSQFLREQLYRLITFLFPNSQNFTQFKDGSGTYSTHAPSFTTDIYADDPTSKFVNHRYWELLVDDTNYNAAGNWDLDYYIPVFSSLSNANALTLFGMQVSEFAMMVFLEIILSFNPLIGLKDDLRDSFFEPSTFFRWLARFLLPISIQEVATLGGGSIISRPLHWLADKLKKPAAFITDGYGKAFAKIGPIKSFDEITLFGSKGGNKLTTSVTQIDGIVSDTSGAGYKIVNSADGGQKHIIKRVVGFILGGIARLIWRVIKVIIDIISGGLKLITTLLFHVFKKIGNVLGDYNKGIGSAIDRSKPALSRTTDILSDLARRLFGVETVENSIKSSNSLVKAGDEVVDGVPLRHLEFDDSGDALYSSNTLLPEGYTFTAKINLATGDKLAGVKRWADDPNKGPFHKFLAWVARKGKGTLDFMFNNRDLNEHLAGTAYTVGAAVKRRNDELLRGYRLANGFGGLCGLSSNQKTVVHLIDELTTDSPGSSLYGGITTQNSCPVGTAEFNWVDSKSFFRNLPIYTKNIELLALPIPLTATRIASAGRIVNGQVLHVQDHQTYYIHIDALQNLKSQDLERVFLSSLMHVAIEARHSMEVIAPGLSLAELRANPELYNDVLNHLLNKIVGSKINPDTGVNEETLSMMEYLGLPNNLIDHKFTDPITQDQIDKAISPTTDATFSVFANMVNWEYESGETLVDVYNRLNSHIYDSDYHKVYYEEFHIGKDNYEAFQIVSDKLVGRALQNYFLSLSDDQLMDSNIVDWHKLPIRFLEYDFRMEGNAYSTPLIGMGTDVFSRARHVNGVTNGLIGLNSLNEFKVWDHPYGIGWGYTDIKNSIFFDEAGTVGIKSQSKLPTYSNFGSVNGRSLSGLFIGPDPSRYDLPLRYDQVDNPNNGIIHQYAYYNWRKPYAAKGAEWVYYDMINRASQTNRFRRSVSNLPQTDFYEDPSIGFVTVPGYKDFGTSLIDRLGRNWANEGVGKVWINPDSANIFGGEIMHDELGRNADGTWITSSPIVQNADGTPANPLLNAVAIKHFNEPYIKNDIELGVITNPKFHSTSWQKAVIFADAENLIASFKQMLAIAIVEHMAKSGQRIEIVSGSIVDTQLGVTLEDQNAFSRAVDPLSGSINAGSIIVHPMYRYSDGSINPDNSYDVEIWVPTGNSIKPDVDSTTIISLDGRMVEEPGVSTIYGKERHGFIGARRDQLDDQVLNEDQIYAIIESHTIDVWQQPETLYAKVSSSNILPTTFIESMKHGAMERLLSEYFALDPSQRKAFRSATYSDTNILDLPGMLDDGESSITNSIALWRMLPFEVQTALRTEVGKTFTYYDSMGMTINWDVAFDSDGLVAEFGRLLRQLVFSGALTNELTEEFILKLLHNPGTTDKYDSLIVNDQGDVSNFGDRRRIPSSNFKTSLIQKNARTFNSLIEEKVGDLKSALINYIDAFDARSQAISQQGTDLPKFNLAMSNLDTKMEDALNLRTSGLPIPDSLKQEIVEGIKEIIHTPEEFVKLDFTKDFDVAHISTRTSGLSKRKGNLDNDGFYIQNKRLFMQSSSDFWTGIYSNLDYFSPNFKSLAISDSILWQKIIDGDPSIIGGSYTELIKQFNPDKKPLQTIFNLRDQLITKLGTSPAGIIIHSITDNNKPFDGIKSLVTSANFPGQAFMQIFNINSILKNNPTALIKGTTEYSEAVKRWAIQILIGSNNPSDNNILVGDIDGLAEYLARILRLPKDQDNLRSGLWALIRSDSSIFGLKRYMDLDSWNRIKDAMDKLIALEGNLPLKDDVWNTLKSIFYWLRST